MNTPAELQKDSPVTDRIRISALRPTLLQDPAQAAIEVVFEFNNLERIFEGRGPGESPPPDTYGFSLRLDLAQALEQALRAANSADAIKFHYQYEDQKEMDDFTAEALAQTARLSQLPNRIFHDIPAAYASNFEELMQFFNLNGTCQFHDVKAKKLLMVYNRSTPVVRTAYRPRHLTLHYGSAPFLTPDHGNYHEQCLDAWHEEHQVFSARLNTQMGNMVLAPMHDFDCINKNDDSIMALSTCHFEMSVTLADSRPRMATPIPKKISGVA